MTSIDKLIKLIGIQLSYREWPGSKGPLICLPSMAGHKGMLDPIASRLAPEYHLYALDLRGRGDSDKPAEGYGFSYHTRDILAFANELGLETFGIIGHSFGATIGVYLASIRPREVKCLVMIDGGADPKEEVLEALRPVVRQLDKPFPSMQAYLDAMRKVPYYQPWNATLERALTEDMQTLPDGRVISKTSGKAIERDLDIQFYYSMCVHFPTLQCPSLFIRPRKGLLDDRAHVLDEREAAAFVNWIPNCWRVDLPDVNHYTMLLSDEPLVVPPIKAFLGTVYNHERQDSSA
jgi:pimeloyl-ACP methyl ester carboxylesterase